MYLVFIQGRREGVKGVTVSRSLALKRGPVIIKIKEIQENNQNSLTLGPKLPDFYSPKVFRP
jgi:hypothetical protein